MTTLQNKKAVIIGGNSGIGLSIATRFLAEGANVLITGRHKNALSTAQKTLNHRARYFICDVLSKHSIGQLSEHLAENNHFPDILVIDININIPETFSKARIDHIDTIINSNLRGLILSVQQCLPHMKKSGSIIFISTGVNHKQPTTTQGIYAATQAAIACLTKTLAIELAPRYIRVNVLTPITTTTGLILDQPARVHSPCKTMSSNSEIAYMAAYLASDDGSYLNATVLSADGVYTSIN